MGRGLLLFQKPNKSPVPPGKFRSREYCRAADGRQRDQLDLAGIAAEPHQRVEARAGEVEREVIPLRRCRGRAACAAPLTIMKCRPLAKVQPVLLANRA